MITSELISLGRYVPCFHGPTRRSPESASAPSRSAPTRRILRSGKLHGVQRLLTELQLRIALERQRQDQPRGPSVRDVLGDLDVLNICHDLVARQLRIGLGSLSRRRFGVGGCWFRAAQLRAASSSRALVSWVSVTCSAAGRASACSALAEITAAASEFYAAQLDAHPEALDYLRGRFGDEIEALRERFTITMIQRQEGRRTVAGQGIAEGPVASTDMGGGRNMGGVV